MESLEITPEAQSGFDKIALEVIQLGGGDFTDISKSHKLVNRAWGRASHKMTVAESDALGEMYSPWTFGAFVMQVKNSYDRHIINVSAIELEKLRRSLSNIEQVEALKHESEGIERVKKEDKELQSSRHEIEAGAIFETITGMQLVYNHYMLGKSENEYLYVFNYLTPTGRIKKKKGEVLEKVLTYVEVENLKPTPTVKKLVIPVVPYAPEEEPDISSIVMGLESLLEDEANKAEQENLENIIDGLKLLM